RLAPFFEPDVELGDLGDAQVADRARSGRDRILGGVLPRAGAGADDFGDAINAGLALLGHGSPLSSVVVRFGTRKVNARCQRILYGRGPAPLAPAALALGFDAHLAAPEPHVDRAVPVGPENARADAFVALQHFRIRMPEAVAVARGDDRPARRDRFEELGAGGSAAAVVRHDHHIGFDFWVE